MALFQKSSSGYSHTIQGIGLVTGQNCRVVLSQPDDVQGIWFEMAADGSRIPACLASIAQCDRGVTLISPTGQTLSIVEHFLAACALSHISNLLVQVDGPELPILDGSAQSWITALLRFHKLPEHKVRLTEPVTVHTPGDIWMVAEPAEGFKINYVVDFPHPDLQNVTVNWQETDGLHIAQAGTFGSLAELPALQARGLALGVNSENTLGFTTEGQYTRALRMPLEPAFHKILDCLGDLMLTGINPLNIGMRIQAHKAGHAVHVQLAQQLKPYLQH